MNGAERVLAALGRKTSAGFPLDFCGSTVTGIADAALSRLLMARGMPNVRKPVDSVQGISSPSPDIVAALGSSTLRIGCDRIVPGRPGAGGSIEARDRFGVLWRRKPGEFYFSQASTPVGEGRLSDALRDFVIPEPDFGEIEASVREGKAEAARLGLFPILDRDCAGIYEMSARLRGVEKLYLDMYDDPEGVEALADAILKYKNEYWDFVLDAWGDGLAGIAEADDYGSEQALLFSPNIIRDVYVARYRGLFAKIRARNAGTRVIFHSCGAVREIIPDLIEAGIDALNPVQYTAAGMDLGELVRDFGDRLTFWGGAVDTKRVLPAGSPEEVRKEVSRNAAILGSRGGFVCAAVHNIQADVPTANILAYLDSAGAGRLA